MEEPLLTAELLRSLGMLLLLAMGVSLVLALLLFVFVIRQLRKIRVPVEAGFSETLRYTPFLVVIFIDLLDFALDVLAAPFAWIVLDRLGLKSLRGVSVVQAVIPLTQAIPALTISWIAVNWFGINFD
ncbi:MAG: hypothetical protein R6X32_06185 [Chloroflexota bacterium]|jgi:hypothetical protein